MSRKGGGTCLSQEFELHSRNNVICTGNQMIPSAIWNKYETLEFELVGRVNFVVFKKKCIGGRVNPFDYLLTI